MKQILPVVAIAAGVTLFAFAALACDMHRDNTAVKTVEAAVVPPALPAPQVVIEPAAQANPSLEIKTEKAMSVPLGGAYENCHRSRQNQTVYLTQ